MTKLYALALASTAALVAWTPVATADSNRVAVVIGANAASPGRRALRFAHSDATSVADVLALSGVAKTDIQTLFDPNPADVLAALDRALAKLTASSGDSILFFYYSGHADATALYPNGKALNLADLRARLDSHAATVRIGVIDACRGGGWTGTKGLREAESFNINVPINLANEGSVLISSSSGLEDAHESEVLQGSFFTHHWSAGLRGAADENQNGRVTLAEAFTYASDLTIRDTAIHTPTPQHPSFQMNLRGRQEIDLVTVDDAKASLVIDQDTGPLQLVDLNAGLVLIELPVGRRRVSLIVPAGDYLVRARTKEAARVTRVAISPGRTANVRESQLRVAAVDAVVAKSYEAKPTPSLLRDGMWRFRFGLGVAHTPTFPFGDHHDRVGFKESATNEGDGGPLERSSVADLEISWGITDRLQLVLTRPAIAYRGGTEGRFEWIPKGGLLGWGFGGGSDSGTWFGAVVGAGLDTRLWLRPETSINTEASLSASVAYATDPGFCPGFNQECNEDAPDNWRGPGTIDSRASIGFSHKFGNLVTINLGVAVESRLLLDGDIARGGEQRDTEISFGSVQSRGFATLPLIELHLSEHWSLFADVEIRRNLRLRTAEERYLLGATWTF